MLDPTVSRALEGRGPDPVAGAAGGLAWAAPRGGSAEGSAAGPATARSRRLGPQLVRREAVACRATRAAKACLLRFELEPARRRVADPRSRVLAGCALHLRAGHGAGDEPDSVSRGTRCRAWAAARGGAGGGGAAGCARPSGSASAALRRFYSQLVRRVMPEYTRSFKAGLTLFKDQPDRQIAGAGEAI